MSFTWIHTVTEGKRVSKGSTYRNKFIFINGT